MSIESVQMNGIRRYYEDWYRPNLMRLVVVGDVEQDVVVEQLTDAFGGLQNPAEPRARRKRSTDRIRPPFEVIHDPELNNSVVQVQVLKDRTTEQYSYSRHVEREILLMVEALIQTRFKDATNRDEFQGFTIENGSLSSVCGGRVELNFTGFSHGSISDESLVSSVLTEVARLRKYGLQPDEFEYARASWLKALENKDDEPDEESSRTINSRLGQWARANELPRKLSAPIELKRNIMRRLTLEDVNRYLQIVLQSDTRIFLATTEADEANRLSLSALNELAEDHMRHDDVEPPKAFGQDRIEIEVPPVETAAKVVNRAHFKASGVTKLELDTGMRVWLKSIPDADDVKIEVLEVDISSHSADDYESLMAGQYGFALARYPRFEQFAGENGLGIGKGWKGQSWGWVVSSDAGRDMNVLLAGLRQVGRDPASVAEDVTQNWAMYLDRMKSMIGSANDPDAIVKRAESENARVRVADFYRDDLDDVAAERAAAFAEEVSNSFGSGDWIVVGAFDEQTIEPVLLAHLGALHAGRTEKGFKLEPTVDQLFPRRDEYLQERILVRAGTAKAAQVTVGYLTKADGVTIDDYAARDLLRALLEKRFQNKIREEMGATYSVDVPIDLSNSRPWVGIRFECDPGRAEELVGVVRSMVNGIVEQGFSEDELTWAKKAFEEKYADDGPLKARKRWLITLLQWSRLDLPPADLGGEWPVIESYTVDKLDQKIADWMGPNAQVLESILMPESPPVEPSAEGSDLSPSP
jgi:zinc protease